MTRLLRATFTRAEVQQMLAYVNARDNGPDSGWYYDTKKQFEARHESIKEMLERLLTSEPQNEGQK